MATDHTDSGEIGQAAGVESSAFESDPVVTIVVPTYKRPDLLEQCLAEIARQTYGRFVVFVCDNSVEREAEPPLWRL